MIRISTGPRSRALAFVAALVIVPASQALAPGDLRLDGLPHYEAGPALSGTIRNFGFGLGGVLALWEEGFRKLHPGVRFVDHLPSSDAAIAALVTGVGDLAPDGGEATLTETLSFFETYGYHPTDITVATGAFDVPGRSNGIVVFVNAANPLTRLTLQQLDGIFGAQRSAGMRGFKWTPSDGRGAQENIRTWGQLGLKGAWADKQIQTYGHAPSGTTRFFQWKVMKNGDKWNPNYREYVESGSKMIADEDRAEQRMGLQRMLRDELAHDRYGIAWTVMPQAKGVAGIKPLALAAGDGSPYIAAGTASFQDRSYPLVRDIHIYLNRAPGQPLDAKLREFLRYALSREGQQAVVRNGGYLPLTQQVAREQLARLE